MRIYASHMKTARHEPSLGAFVFVLAPFVAALVDFSMKNKKMSEPTLSCKCY